MHYCKERKLCSTLVRMYSSKFGELAISAWRSPVEYRPFRSCCCGLHHVQIFIVRFFFGVSINNGASGGRGELSSKDRFMGDLRH